MIFDGLNGKNDVVIHTIWLQHFSHQLAEGIWYPRWLDGTNYGYGSPTFVFYPPLVYYIGSVFKLSGLNIEQTMGILYSLGIFLSGVSFYLYARFHWGKIAALSGALIYMSVPHITFMIYWVGSISSLFGIALLPLGWLITERSLSQKRWLILLSLFWMLLALIHVPSFFLFFLVWLMCTSCFLLKQPWKNVLSVFFFAGIGIGISSFFLLPAFLEKRFVDINAMKELAGDFQGNMLGGATLPFLPLNFNGEYMHVFLHQSLIAIIAFGLAFFIFKDHKEIIKQISIWGVFLIAIAYLMSYWSWPIWRLSQTLQRVQTPMRLLPLFSFGVASLSCFLIYKILQLRHKVFKIVALSLLTAVLLANFSFNYKTSRMSPAIHNPGKANLDYLQEFKTALYEPFTGKLKDVREYRPLLEGDRSPPDPKIGEAPLSVIEGDAKIRLLDWESYKRIFSVDTNENSVVRIRTYIYPAWNLYVNQENYPIEVLSDGTIGISLEPGSYMVELKYERTWAFTLGLILSTFSVLTLLVLYYLIQRFV
ncbi:MAG: hypothetical protein F6K25_00780 [Okeania sp. SIO2G4]|nr:MULTISPECIES: hypothetical protein [unclassified Okeania]NEP91938.1 hypothetical protein [Okeania sp. SIO2F5]NEQ89361.1 hypothetical protein [Okeania sp. SIO2G4]